MQKHDSKYFARSPLPQEMRSICQIPTFSEHGHVILHVKLNGLGNAATW